MTSIPSVQYTQSSGFSLAYQIVGSGSQDIVYLLFESPNVVANWFIPEHATFMEGLASISRLIVTDRRGMGCSDRLPPGTAPTLEELVDDLMVIMETAYASSATLVAGSESAFIAMLAAATHPDRFKALVLWNASPSWKQSADLPTESSEDRVRHELGVNRRITSLRAWAEVYARETYPSSADDPDIVGTVEAMSALSASPETWFHDQQMFYSLDLRPLLPSIRTPTLLLARPEVTRYAHIESARFMAERLPSAKLVQLPGRDMFPWVGDSAGVVNEIREFMTGDRRPPEPDRALATVMFTDIVGSTERAAALGDRAWRDVIDRHDELIRAQLQRYRGREIDTAGDGFFATFDGPARAVECARDAVAAIADLGVAIRAGCHTGEVERAGPDVRGIAVHIGSRVAAIAGPSEVLVTQTTKDLVAGSGLAFEDVGEHELKGVPDRWHLYRVVG